MGRILIGRHSAVGLRIAPEHEAVSRVHAEVWRDVEGRIFLQDLDSQHGTTVNGVGIGRMTLLKPGDRICFGGAVSVSFGELEQQIKAVTAGEGHEFA